MTEESDTEEGEAASVEVGKLGRAHGVEGEVRVFTRHPDWELFEPGGRLYVEGGMGPRKTVTIEQWRIADEFVIAKFDEIDDRDAAEKLTNRILTIPEAELPDLGDDEYYHHDLEGLEVRVRPAEEEEDGEARRIGVVSGIFETGANDVMVVDVDDGDDLYVPMFEGAVEPIAPEDATVYLRPLEEWAPEDTDI